MRPVTEVWQSKLLSSNQWREICQKNVSHLEAHLDWLSNWFHFERRRGKETNLLKTFLMTSSMTKTPLERDPLKMWWIKSTEKWLESIQFHFCSNRWNIFKTGQKCLTLILLWCSHLFLLIRISTTHNIESFNPVFFDQVHFCIGHHTFLYFKSAILSNKNTSFLMKIKNQN